MRQPSLKRKYASFTDDRRKKMKKIALTHSGAKYGRQRYGEEMKVHHYVSEGTLNAEDKTFSCALIPQGDDIINRQGRKTNIRHIRMRLGVTDDIVTDHDPGAVRVLLLWDRQPCGALSSVALFNNYATGQHINGSVPNLVYGTQFVVLYDVTKTFGGTHNGTNESAVSGPKCQTWECDIPVNFSQTYNATTANIADLNQGNLILCITSGYNGASNYNYYAHVSCLFRG